jgi:hypothetical protein
VKQAIQPLQALLQITTHGSSISQEVVLDTASSPDRSTLNPPCEASPSHSAKACDQGFKPRFKAQIFCNSNSIRGRLRGARTYLTAHAEAALGPALTHLRSPSKARAPFSPERSITQA